MLHEGFEGIASIEEAALLAPVCAKRASGILFWAVFEDGRHDDLDQCDEALELLWAPVTVDCLRYAVPVTYWRVCGRCGSETNSSVPPPTPSMRWSSSIQCCGWSPKGRRPPSRSEPNSS